MTSATSTQFSSDGFDLDAAAGNDGEVVYEIGGGSTAAAPGARSEDGDRKFADTKGGTEREDPTARSEALKAEGNENFKAGDYLDAYDRYTDAIEACPGLTGSEILRQRDEFDERQRELAYQRHREETERRRGREDAASDAEKQTSDGEEEAEGKDRDEKRPKKFQAPPHPHGSKLAIYHCNRAACCLHLDRNSEAESDCDVAILLNPGYVKAYLRRMTARENMDQTDKALEDAKTALFYDPTNANAKKSVSRLQKIEDERLEKLKEETMGKLKDLGNSILGNFGLSLDNFKAEKDPNTGSYNISFEQNK